MSAVVAATQAVPRASTQFTGLQGSTSSKFPSILSRHFQYWQASAARRSCRQSAKDDQRRIAANHSMRQVVALSGKRLIWARGRAGLWSLEVGRALGSTSSIIGVCWKAGSLRDSGLNPGAAAKRHTMAHLVLMRTLATPTRKFRPSPPPRSLHLVSSYRYVAWLEGNSLSASPVHG